ncbi:hypothetical protein JCM10212_006470 [Sporobolomyces blumeae]
MPPRRARASSVSNAPSTHAEPDTPRRRSGRKSIPVVVPPPVGKKPATPRKSSTGAGAASKKAKKVVLKKSRKEEDFSEEEEEDSDEDEDGSESESGEEQATSTGSKKRKAANGASKAKKQVKGGRAAKRGPADAKPKQERPIKALPPPKPRRAAIEGMNALPHRFEVSPRLEVFANAGFDVPELPAPEKAPRTIFVFGTGDMGQHGLGTDTLDEIKRPRRHAGVEQKIQDGQDGWQGGVGELVCGGMHTLAIDGNGKVWSWGINDNAALGRVTAKPDIESEELEANLFPVEGLTGANEEEFRAVRVAAGDSVSLAVSEQGEVKAWGSFRSAEGLLGFDGSSSSGKTQLHPTSLKNLDKHTVVQIACGDDHFLALTSKGQVFACGNGEQNQLGRKIVQRHKTHGLTPERLALKNIVLVGSGSYHSFAVDESGRVFAWGSNSFHQTGVSDEDGGYADVISSPTVVEALNPDKHDGARVVQIAGGAHHSLFLFSNGEVWVVGRSDGHEVGLADDHPEMKASEERKEEARKERQQREQDELKQRFDADGNVTKEDDDGEKLSKDAAEFEAKEAAAKGVPLPNDYCLVPTRLAFPKEPKANDPTLKADDFDDSDVETEPTRIVSIAAGTRHNFAVSSRGYVYSWGVGPSSQLGQGNEEEIETPTRIWNTALSNVRVIKAETGGQHSVVVGIDRDYEAKYEKRIKDRQEKEKAKAEEEAPKQDKEKKEDAEGQTGVDEKKSEEKKEEHVNGEAGAGADKMDVDDTRVEEDKNE